jgi:hypothetical protein
MPCLWLWSLTCLVPWWILGFILWRFWISILGRSLDAPLTLLLLLVSDFRWISDFYNSTLSSSILTYSDVSLMYSYLYFGLMAPTYSGRFWFCSYSDLKYLTNSLIPGLYSRLGLGLIPFLVSSLGLDSFLTLFWRSLTVYLYSDHSEILTSCLWLYSDFGLWILAWSWLFWLSSVDLGLLILFPDFDPWCPEFWLYSDFYSDFYSWFLFWFLFWTFYSGFWLNSRLLYVAK